MQVNVRAAVVGGVCLMVGFVLGFFTAGPALFADGSGLERVGAVALSLAAFGFCGAIAGFFARDGWRFAAAMLAFPVVPVVLLFGEDLVLVAVLVVGDLAASLMGAWLVVRRAQAGGS